MIIFTIFTVITLSQFIVHSVSAALAGGKLLYDKHISHRSMPLALQQDFMIRFAKCVFIAAIWLFLMKTVGYII